MLEPEFATPEQHFIYGKRMLVKKRYYKALSHFRVSVEVCRVQDKKLLSQYLYWLGLALYKIGKPELALKSYVSAQRLRRRGYIRKTYLRISNGYGMLKRSSIFLDDYYAFSSIQVSRYLEKTYNSSFQHDLEKMTVMTIINEAWEKLFRANILYNVAIRDKIKLFKEFDIAFPSYYFLRNTNVIYKDFSDTRLQDPDRRCSCGSGLLFRQCCGRVSCADELSYGCF
jgi:tetratricopeptide (TPR) repeat protein